MVEERPKPKGLDVVISKKGLRPKRGEKILVTLPAILYQGNPLVKGVDEATQDYNRTVRFSAKAATLLFLEFQTTDRITGRLTITNQRLHFEPDILALMRWRSEDMPYEEIAEVRKGGYSLGIHDDQMVIRNKAGKEYLFAVEKRDEVMTSLLQQIDFFQHGSKSSSEEPSVHPSLVDRKKGVGDAMLALDDGISSVGGVLRNKMQERAKGRLLGRKGATSGPNRPETLSSELERLADLHAKGALTDEEFQNAKSRLLDG